MESDFTVKLVADSIHKSKVRQTGPTIIFENDSVEDPIMGVSGDDTHVYQRIEHHESKIIDAVMRKECSEYCLNLFHNHMKFAK